MGETETHSKERFYNYKIERTRAALNSPESTRINREQKDDRDFNQGHYSDCHSIAGRRLKRCPWRVPVPMNTHVRPGDYFSGHLSLEILAFGVASMDIHYPLGTGVCDIQCHLCGWKEVSALVTDEGTVSRQYYRLQPEHHYDFQFLSCSPEIFGVVIQGTHEAGD